MPRTLSSPSHAAVAGAAIRKARISTGITQTALAERLDVTAAYIYKLEAGRSNATIGMLARIAAALDAELVVDFQCHPQKDSLRALNLLGQ